MHRGIEEIFKPFLAQHVRDLMRIADKGRGAARQNTAVIFEWRKQRTFDVAMGVDKAGNGDQAAATDFNAALVLAIDADDAIASDGDVRFPDRVGVEIEELDVLDREIGLGNTSCLIDVLC